MATSSEHKPHTELAFIIDRALASPYGVPYAESHEAREALGSLVEQFETCREHLREIIDVAIWMSGSEDFAPNGKCGSAWPEQRERLYAALAFLNSNPASEPKAS